MLLCISYLKASIHPQKHIGKLLALSISPLEDMGAWPWYSRKASFSLLTSVTCLKHNPKLYRIIQLQNIYFESVARMDTQLRTEWRRLS